MTKESIGKKVGAKYLSPVLLVVVLVLLSNVFGLVPYLYSLTLQLAVTLVLAGGVWIGKLFVGIRKHGLSLLGMFIPSGLPFGMVPFFVVIELIGFCIPLISLLVRLFANIMSGHVLVKVLFGFIFAGSAIGGLIGLISVIPQVLLLLLLGLETGVLVIQAYVFGLLLCIYLGDMEAGKH